MSKYNQKVHDLTDSVLVDDYEQKRYIYSGRHDKSIFCHMVLRLMDTAFAENDYCKALGMVLVLFPEVDRNKLEKELDKYI